jgi:mono/diheme cytochrome c family protein
MSREPIMSPKYKRILVTTLLCLGSPALAGGALAAPASASPEAGKALAIEACGACHQVIPTQKRPAPVANPDEGVPTQAPTFTAIAERCASADQLRAKIANPHYPMREQALGALDLDSLAAYIRSLAPGKTCPIH